MQQMRSGRRLAPREGRRMWIMAGGANLSLDGSRVAFPVTTRPAMHTGFPIAIRRPMTTSAQRRTFHDLQVTTIPGLEQLKVRLIMTIKTVVVSIMAAMAHDNVVVFLGQNHVGFRIELQF